jgi:sarcosine oxidase, subunit gamma
MLENRTIARRLGSLDHIEPWPATPAVTIRALPPEARFVLRLGAADAARLGKVGGLDIMQPINRMSRTETRLAARLGPDEWLLIAPEAEAEVVQQDVAQALAGCPHALVDVSHRNAAIRVTGTAAAVVINAGCPLDLGRDRFAPCAASRTLLGKAEIVLLHIATAEGDGGYRIECWRSFARYVHAFLVQAATEHVNG